MLYVLYQLVRRDEIRFPCICPFYNMTSRKIFIPKHTTNYSVEVVKTAKSIFSVDSAPARTVALSVSIQQWLKKHGQDLQAPMSDRDRQAIRECFDLIDTDSSGSLDVKEVYELFEVGQYECNSGG